MKLVLTLLLSFICLNVFAQTGLNRIEQSKEFLIYNSDREERNEYYFKLKPVSASQKQYHFRYDNGDTQIVDIYGDDAGGFKGYILNSVREYNENDTDVFWFERVEIPDSSANKLGKVILSERYYLTPTDSLIDGWNHNWLDCEWFALNYKVDTAFYNKDYNCLSGQKDSIQEIVKLKQLDKSIADILNLKDVRSEFQNKLPRGKSYSLGAVMMYIMTERESELWEKGMPIREYKKTIKDTIDGYLEKRLNELVDLPSGLDCFDTYHLTFSKQGRLKKMTVNMGFWERLFDKDYKKCRRVLKKAFRSIKIDFVDPKYPFYRELHFYRREISIYDPTLY